MPIWLLKKTCMVGARSRPIILAENLVFLNLLMMLELLFSNHIIYNYSFSILMIKSHHLINLFLYPFLFLSHLLELHISFSYLLCQMHDVFKHTNLSVWGRLNHNPSCCYLFYLLITSHYANKFFKFNKHSVRSCLWNKYEL